MIEIDGSFGEGGGQILRTSLALSLLTQKPFHLANVRAKRSRPGLQPQHLMSVRAAATIGQANVQGDSKGSTDLVFEPGEIKPGRYRFDVGTAGATALVLHTIYLPLTWGASEQSEVTLVGGTHVINAPCFHFLDITWKAYLAKLGMNVSLAMQRPGFYPRGGGEIDVTFSPCDQIEGLRLKKSHVEGASVLSASAGLPDHVSDRQTKQALRGLKKLGIRADSREEKWQGGPGSVVMISLETSPVPTTYFGLGEKRKTAEQVADEAVKQVKEHQQAKEGAVDAHSADQLVLPLSLADNGSEYTVTEVTQHLLTNVAVIQKFVDREIVCEGEEGQPGCVRIS